MIAIIISLRFLACSGNAIRGHDAFDGNLQLLLHERGNWMYRTSTLTTVVKDMLLRMTISIDKLLGHCFDGAANMSDPWNGVQKHLTEEFPKSSFVHCSNHTLDLALQETARKQEVMCDTLMIVKDISNLIL
ncbi:hypothetical protein PR048_004692 [Dryococelus australis]|uniref:DUF4371 domain-containing protein n=1 Tax=Dryococelus australis TaxID=614101 RepID=A0ABQ9I645_9NEOP|nr:hypothetical protein PR048_004692 [Dryococelus australis]